MQLTPQSVRTAMLAAQGLLAPPAAAPTRADALSAIRRMGYLQIDTIQALWHSQSLVLWSRLGDYDVDWLYQLHAQDRLFEYDAHFDFDYRMESYTPVKDRKYGYFCLPILHRGRLVGRLDPKAHRQQKRMEIKKVYLEPEVELTDDLAAALRQTLAGFTVWHGMERLEITDADRPELLEALSQ